MTGTVTTGHATIGTDQILADLVGFGHPTTEQLVWAAEVPGPAGASEGTSKSRMRSPRQHGRMPATERRIDRALRETEQALANIGKDIRQARLEHGLSQETTARAAGVSPAAISRLERGVARRVPLEVVARIAIVVGLVLSVRAFPMGAALRDAAHLALLGRLRAILPAIARWQTEVPVPKPGDLRAWDALIRLAGVPIGVEAETRARDAQSLQRRIALKHRGRPGRPRDPAAGRHAAQPGLPAGRWRWPTE